MENSDRRRRNWNDDTSRRNPQRADYGPEYDRDRDPRNFGYERFDEIDEPRGRYAEGRGGRERSGDDRSFGDSSRGYESRDYEGGDGSRFEPDWSQEGSEPRYSSDPYYARNREYQARGERSGAQDYGRDPSHPGRRAWRGDEYRTTTREQRERGFEPRRGFDRGDRENEWGAQGRGDYESRESWPSRGRGYEAGRGRESDDDTHYHGYWRRSVTPYSYPGGRGNLYMESWMITGPHTGRGPKGYRRSEQQIVEEACQRLERDGEIDASDIEVNCEPGGVIRLRGTVPDRQTKRRAEDCVESIYGVRDVMNELRVAQPGERPQSDEAGGAEASQSGSKSAPGMSSPSGQASGAQAQGAQSAGSRTSASPGGGMSQGASGTSASDDGKSQKGAPSTH